MAFWGIEIKPGKPYIHRYDDESGRLHVSQATLGTGSSAKKSVVECKVGDKNPIYLCSLLPERIETCALNLEFQEDDAVTFSVNGPHSVHLSGFFYGEDEDQDYIGDDYGIDLYEGNIVGSDSEDEDASMSYDSYDDKEDDDLSEDDLRMFPSSPIPNSGVKIEEIVDDKEINNEIRLSNQGRKKKNQADISDGNGNSNHQIVVKAGSGVPVLESEDEDGFPAVLARENKSDFSTASKSVKACERTDGKTKRKKETDEIACEKRLKRKNDSLGQDWEPDRDSNEPCGSSAQPDKIAPENDVKKKNKKKKVSKKEDIGKESGIPNSNGVEKLPESEIGNDLGPNKKKKKENKKKKQCKEGESVVTVKADELTNEKASSMEKEDIKSSHVRTFSNGLVIEEVAMGKPDGKRASPGEKVSVLYIGKLKKNGKIFDSNIGRAPFKFRLGIGQVIKGWDIGVNGMRIGDKRRLTIPPAMGYGAKGCGPAIPPNSWLVFDVELVAVN